MKQTIIGSVNNVTVSLLEDDTQRIYYAEETASGYMLVEDAQAAAKALNLPESLQWRMSQTSHTLCVATA
jgi:hypothetical protein